MSKTKTSPSAAERAASTDIPAEMNTAVLAAVATAMETSAKVLFDWQAEMSRSVARRLEQVNKLQRGLFACRDVGEAAALQQEWILATTRDYLDEMTRLAGPLRNVAGEIAASQEASAAASSQPGQAVE